MLSQKNQVVDTWTLLQISGISSLIWTLKISPILHQPISPQRHMKLTPKGIDDIINIVSIFISTRYIIKMGIRD